MSDRFLIWSNERGMFWRPGRVGYTTLTHRAGQYSRAEAEEIVANANRAVRPGEQPEEVMLACPWSSWAAEEYGMSLDEGM
jgi:hypothetical protein